MTHDARVITVEGRGAMWALLFLEDGKHLLSGGEDGMIRQWDIEQGVQVAEPITGCDRIRALALSGDRKWIVSGEFKQASVWDRYTWKKVLGVQEHTREIEAVDISSDSTKFATGAKDKKAFVWDIATGRKLLGPFEHDHSVVSAKFSPDGDYFATATWNCDSLRIYSVHTGQLIRTIPVKAHGIGTIKWSSDSQRIFASSINSIKHIYVDTGAFILQSTITGETNPSSCSLAVPKNGRFIACFVGSSLTLMDASSGLRFGPVFEHSGQHLRAVALTLDNNYVATTGEGGVITIRDLRSIIPLTYLTQQPRNPKGSNPRLQLEALEAFRGTLRTLESRFEELGGVRLTSTQTTPLHISDGTYRIKSYIADEYLTCPQERDGIVAVEKIDLSSERQMWCVFQVEDGAYNIVGRRGSTEVPLSNGSGNELICIPDGSSAWTIEPRGHAYVIGDAVNAKAVHLTQRPRHVSTLLRDNSQNQRWVFEHVQRGIGVPDGNEPLNQNKA